MAVDDVMTTGAPIICDTLTIQRPDTRRHILFRNYQSPGDLTMLTAAVRDLHRAHPNKFVTAVECPCPALWEHNPYAAKVTPENKALFETVRCDYPLIHRSNTSPYHFIHGFAQDLEQKLGVRIPLTDFKGDIYLSQEERSWVSQVHQHFGHAGPFWIIVSGGKTDFTAKWWDPRRYQQVVDRFRHRIQFVQVGEAHHRHPPLDGVINLVGKTDARQLIRLVYHADGVLCPVTFLMHLAAAVPVKDGKPKNRACVVVAGGREPSQWEAYPHHQYLHTNGALMCCDNGGCWKSRAQKVGDGDKKDTQDLCVNPVAASPTLTIARCMEMITAADVCRAIERYYEGGALRYLGPPVKAAAEAKTGAQ